MDERTFHEGERAAQARLGIAGRMAEIGARLIRDHMPDQHREFFAGLPLLLVGSVDASGRPSASPLLGPPGFVASPDAATLVVTARPLPGDGLAANLMPGAPLGVLGIELPTRRRNRANGVVSAVSDGGFRLQVRQSFGNCPQHIHRRPFPPAPPPLPAAAPRHEGARLSGAARALIASADTFFIASATPAGPRRCDGVDVSHRGGPPGFVALGDGGEDALLIPDYGGNRFFNTVGNLLLWPRAGLLFPDFSSGAWLQLTGRAEILWEGEEVERAEGAERLLRFLPEEGAWLGAP